MTGWFSKRNFRRRQNIGLAFGLFTGVLIVIWLSLPANARLRAPGNMNIGHDKLSCDECHIPTAGSFRQKIQANAQYWLGVRQTFVSLGYAPVANEDCLDCHERPDERHPVFRFFEPRFKKARAEIGAQYCVSCHREHSGVRVTVDMQFCALCHKRLDIKNDPLMTVFGSKDARPALVSHKQLVQSKRWNTCLGCHDFHGNHRMKTETSMARLIDSEVIKKYFQGSKSPYSKDKYHKAKKTRTHGKDT